jgi:hypothetical protein
MSSTRPLTQNEASLVPFALQNLQLDVENNYYFGFWDRVPYFAQNPAGPWIDEDRNPLDFLSLIPDSDRIQRINPQTLEGHFHGRKARWSISQHAWTYHNHRPINFDEEEAEISAILENPESPVIAGPSHLPTPYTPGIPQQPLRAASPSPSRGRSTARTQTPAHSAPQTPSPTRFPSPPTRNTPSPPVQAPQVGSNPPHPQTTSPIAIPVAQAAPPAFVPPAPVQVAPPVPPANPAMATPKVVGTPPEAFDGKPEKAETFWSQLENYYYLNEAAFTTESRRVSAALTHFKSGTPAGDWARDRTTAALAANPRDFGTWATFKAAFNAHFVPAESALEAGAEMHNYYQGSKPFNEWYQKWYTHASRAGVDEQTKMFAFRRNLNQALHNKLLTLSPQPATLAGLVEKAREFDRLWQLYTSNAFTQRRQGARVRATNTEEESPRIGYSGTSQSSQSQTPRGPLSKEERKRRFDNKLCLYCGRAGHIARDCRQKSTASQGKKPGIPPPKVRAVAPDTKEEDEPSLDGLQISSMRISSECATPMYYDAGIVRPKSAPQDF